MMLSRMGEALYWMARYLERADNTARLLAINLSHLVGDEVSSMSTEQWEPLLTITGGTQTFFSLPHNREITKSTVVAYLTYEPANFSSIHNCMRLARENARVVRDMISKEMWESLNQSWLAVDRALKNPLTPDRAPAFYTQIRNASALFHGLASATMMGGESYGFFRLGAFVERADMTARILDVKYHILLPSVSEVGSPLDFYQWGALLKSLSGFEAFRRLHHIGIRPIDVTGFVVFNPDFPRGLSFCVNRMQRALEQIGYGTHGSATADALAGLASALETSTPESIFQSGLHEFLQAFLIRVAALTSAVQSDYFESNLGEKNALLYRTSNLD